MGKKSINTQRLLKRQGYTGRQNFQEIAKWASVNQEDYANEEALLDALEREFGPASPKNEMHLTPRPYRLWSAPALPLDQGAIAQLETALRLPVAVGGAGMPDLHRGYSLPIGGVVVLDKAISPAFVGYDISCMVMMTIFDTEEDVGTRRMINLDTRERYLRWLLRSTSFGLGARSLGMEHEVMDDPHWRQIAYLRGMKDLAASQLGSSGAGNHFADIVVGRYTDGSGEFVGLLTHSGSRGVGNKVGHYYSHLADVTAAQKNRFPGGYGWFELKSAEGQEYLQVMNLMGEYAMANHELIHACFTQVSGLHPVRMITNRHNFAWVEEHGLVCHRKGATPAGLGQMGIIPGSSGSESFLVSGKGIAESYYSASHGAGRPWSRTEARRRFNVSAFNKHMAEMGITHHGVAMDETVAAYKDIHSVMQAQSDLVDVVAALRPRVVVMGGHQISDDGD